MTGSWEDELQSLKEHLLSKFKGRVDMDPKTFLGLEIEHRGDDRILHRTGYCRTIVEMVYKEPMRPVSTPLEHGSDLTSRKNEEGQLDPAKHPYRQILGKLMYLAHITRPDISNAVRELGRQMHDPCMRYWKGIQHLLRYLGTYSYLGVPFKKEWGSQGLCLRGYADADFAADPETRRSCVGYVVLLGETMISWTSRTERSVVLSTTESEWTALAPGIRHANFLGGIMKELGFVQSTIPWFCDNQATIVSAKTMGFNGRTQHVDVKLKFTRQACERGRVTLQYVPTNQQLADCLTKRLRRIKHGEFVTTVLENIC